MNVLVIGNRQGLNKALKELKGEFTLLTNHKLKFAPKDVQVIEVESFPQSDKKIMVLYEELKKLNIKPTHIIAAVEAAVYTATILRRKFNCRISKHSVVRKCTNKSEMKKFLLNKDIPMGKFIVSEISQSSKDIVKKLNFPIVVKEIGNSGGRGIRFVHSEEELQSVMGSKLLYEEFIEGQEGSVESFISHKEILFTNITEYFQKGFSNIVPATFSDELKNDIRSLNKKVIEALSISWGMTHLEFYITKSGLLFGEIALRPPGGYIMKLIELSYGFNPWRALVSVELDLDFDFSKTQSNFSGCLIFHPGEGEVEKVIKPNADSLTKFYIKVDKGDKTFKRQGVGEDIGYSLFSHKDHVQIKSDILKVKASSVVQLKNLLRVASRLNV